MKCIYDERSWTYNQVLQEIKVRKRFNDRGILTFSGGAGDEVAH